MHALILYIYELPCQRSAVVAERPRDAYVVESFAKLYSRSSEITPLSTASVNSGTQFYRHPKLYADRLQPRRDICPIGQKRDKKQKT